MKKLSSIKVDTLQVWGEKEVGDCEFPKTIARQTKEDANLFDIISQTYNDYGDIVTTSHIGQCEKGLIEVKGIS